ncbi:putative protein N(5)-glutamine methyltransferase [Verrucosispora sp. WMMA2044]|uniref:peptide chain release factor N(5)-glutamine methyltransferase n=1 Tax=Verrucosispora sioxanthis TaxID=2499994 RepID=A0A6M1L510_9ACTN|nr:MULTISPECIES: putative protein N(5)-glutamine methyltransferase [Micromonospora]NEE62794.1 putative protein N(5)-glutamine methyltransferase [Verrucosispora sioxanthis]NGM11904.1 putative protein N(5)-glutamine methyltransferase [Verrucosispora sioxanthis]WBB47164.1 putative protein N(5)-glutamine methyltransferase [Verrucosispora sp. WMMA2044]
MGASVFPVGYDALVARLRQAGCVWAEEEARLLLAVDGGPETLADLVDRRVAGEPLEYLLGWAEFCGERIEVDPGVFVPRARTALLVSTAVAVTGPAATVVELCCGSGAISRVLARRLAAPRLLAAVDVDPAAVACARRNLAAVGVPVLAGDLFDPLPAAWRGRLDLVVANAPYVPTVAMALLPPEARRYESAAALDGGSDGLAVLRRLAAAAPQWLAPGGHLVVEVGQTQVERFRAVLSEAGLVPSVVRDDAADATAMTGRCPDDVAGGRYEN